MGMGNFEGGAVRCNVWRRSAMTCAKTANGNEFGIWTQVDPRKHVLAGVHTGAAWRIPLNRPCAVAMRSVVKLLWRLSVKFWYAGLLFTEMTKHPKVECTGYNYQVELTESLNIVNHKT